MSKEAKIGVGLAVVALVGVLWFATGGSRERVRIAPAASKAPSERQAKSAGARPPSERVKERLAQLRAERLAAGGAPGGERPFPRTLPTPAVGQVGENAAAPPVEDEPNLADLDFETLRDMALIDEDPDNRISAIWLLASLEEEEPALPVLTQALSDEDPEVRMAAIQALSEFSEEAPIDTLQMALQDSDAEIRFEALSIAAEMADERVQPLIAQALDDPDEDVRSLAEGLADMEDTYEPPATPPS